MEGSKVKVVNPFNLWFITNFLEAHITKVSSENGDRIDGPLFSFTDKAQRNLTSRPHH